MLIPHNILYKRPGLIQPIGYLIYCYRNSDPRLKKVVGVSLYDMRDSRYWDAVNKWGKQELPDCYEWFLDTDKQIINIDTWNMMLSDIFSYPDLPHDEFITLFQERFNLSIDPQFIDIHG